MSIAFVNNLDSIEENESKNWIIDMDFHGL